ncbi:DnaA N-terminal domain-containing protein [Cytobacillus sp. FSL W8-0315]|uniref:DnaA N-terminal domain-containing protein n=1 Tax=Cytobacillus sp. FSL W8-0315 TaxID=2921600 RepID=UPI0030F7B37F
MEVLILKDARPNLKGENYPLIYYRPVKEDLKIEKSRWLIDKTGQFKEFFYHDPVVNKILFNEEKVKEFSLDGYGQNIEFEDRNFTIIHNYLIHFWQHFLKADGLALFITLKSYCIEKDYCWPALKTLQLQCSFGSVNTVKSRLSLLERYGFVFRFNCMSADEKKKNMDETPIYKVRRRVPFLPKELYEELPEELKRRHDDFMEKYMSVYSPDNLGNVVNYEGIYEDFIEQGETFHKPVKKRNAAAQKHKLDIKESMTTDDLNLTKQVLEYIQAKISKPSFDTWFKDSLFKNRDSVITLYAQNKFAASWINDRHMDLITQALNDLNINFLDIKIISIEE